MWSWRSSLWTWRHCARSTWCRVETVFQLRQPSQHERWYLLPQCLAGGHSGGGHHQGPLRVTFNQDQPLEDAQAQAFITDRNTENGHFSEINEYYFTSRVCCLLSSHCLPDDIHVVPADCTTMILPPDARSLSTVSCVTSGAVADTGNYWGVTSNLENVISFTGESVNISGVHSDAIKCAGAIIKFRAWTFTTSNK